MTQSLSHESDSTPVPWASADGTFLTGYCVIRPYRGPLPSDSGGPRARAVVRYESDPAAARDHADGAAARETYKTGAR